MQKNDKIVIIGITGYTGAWLATKLVEQGFTQIIGTYRNNEKWTKLKKQLPSITGVKADLIHSVEKVSTLIKGSKWVFNNSAPFTGKEQTIDDFIKTKQLVVDQLFHAIKKAGTVKKLVHLGSAAAVGFGNTDPHKKTITEEDWTDVEHLDYPYERFVVMKTYEERRIWELANQLNLAVTIIHPTNIIGPSCVPWHHDMIFANLNKGTYLVNGPMDCIDVRDVAMQEIALMENPASDGKRVLGIGFSFSFEALVLLTKQTLTDKKIEALFTRLPEIVPAELALSLWKPLEYTSFYKDHGWRLRNQTIFKTIYPDIYAYHYTDPETSVTEALTKMYEDLATN